MTQEQELEVGDECERCGVGELLDEGGMGKLTCDECRAVHSIWGDVIFHPDNEMAPPWVDQYGETDPVKKEKYRATGRWEFKHGRF